MTLKSVYVDAFGRRYRASLDKPIDIAIPLEFSGSQPSHFAAPVATARPLEVDGFVGDTRVGGSCNCDEVTLIPHCNGTHTECVGHITHDRVNVHQALEQSLMTALLVSVVPVSAAEQKDDDSPDRPETDRLITRQALEKAASGFPEPTDALIVRTLPNPADKKTQNHAESMPPYFSTQAMKWVTKRYEHLLVDLPSVDRSHDQGKLSGHRIFWGMKHDSREYRSAGFPDRTITEMIFVDDAVGDGLYLLNLQIPAFVSDAAPSRPRLFPLKEEKHKD